MILEYNLFLWKISCFMFLFVNSNEQSEIMFNDQSDDPGKKTICSMNCILELEYNLLRKISCFMFLFVNSNVNEHNYLHCT